MLNLARLIAATLALAVVFIASVPPQVFAQKSEKAEKSRKEAPSDKSAAQPAAQPANAWSVTCSDRGQPAFKCEMTQTLIEEASRRILAVLSVTKDGPATSMLMRLPHGVYLPAGVSLKVDRGETKKLVFQRSDNAGVYAGLPLDEKSLEAFNQGKVLSLGLELEPGKTFELAARLEGFGPALERLASIK